MNCPVCSRQIERVEMKHAKRNYVVIRCPGCSDSQVDLGKWLSDLWGTGVVKCEVATNAQAVEMLMSRVPEEPDAQLTAVVAMTLFSWRCWAAFTEEPDPDQLRQKIDAFRELLAADLCKARKGEVPL